LVLIYARIRRPETRQEFWSRVENMPGERVAATIYERSISEWDEGLWQEEIDWMRGLLEGTTESVIIWQFVGGQYSRYTIGAGD
jgi:hypothetical protein